MQTFCNLIRETKALSEGCNKVSNIVQAINKNEKSLQELGEAFGELKRRLDPVTLNLPKATKEELQAQPDRERSQIDRLITENGYRIEDIITEIRNIINSLEI